MLAVEPNIKDFDEFEIFDYSVAYEQADVVVFLVAHREFEELEMEGSLNFCGVSNV